MAFRVTLISPALLESSQEMANSTTANTEENKEVKKPPVAGADTNQEVDEKDGDGAEQKDKINAEGVQAAYTECADRSKVNADGTATPNCPKANITSDAITFTPAEEKPKDGGFFGFMGRVAKGAWDGLTGLVKGAYDAAAGVVNNVLDNVWKQEFGSEANAKVIEKDGKVVHLTATDGVGRESKVIDTNGKITTVQDSRGNTTHYDSTTGQIYATDKDGGKYTTAENGDSIYTAKDGSQVIQHKDGTREFKDKSGNRMEQGDRTLRQRFDNLDRVITDKAVIDTVKDYHGRAVAKIFNHGNVPPESVPTEVRNQPGVHNFGTQTEKVEDDGFKTVQDRDGRRRFGHCRDGKLFDVKEGADGKPEFYRNGQKVDFENLPEWMKRRFAAARNGSNESTVAGVEQVKIATSPEGKPSTTIGAVTISASPEGVIKTDVATGPKPEDKVTYTNEADGKQTGPGQDGRRFVFDTDNKETPYREVDKDGNTVLTYNANTNRLWTPEYTSTPEGVQLANGNFIHRDGTVTNSEGRTILNSHGYSSSSPEYQHANAQVISAVGNTSGIIGQAKANPVGMSESAIEGCISDLSKALAQCIKTGNYERINQIFGAIADAYGALADVRVAKAKEQQRQLAMQNGDDLERLNAANRVA